MVASLMITNWMADKQKIFIVLKRYKIWTYH